MIRSRDCPCLLRHSGDRNRQSRVTVGKLGTEIVTDPGLHEAMVLMRAAGIPCDRMHPDDDWNFPGYMKEPVL